MKNEAIENKDINKIENSLSPSQSNKAGKKKLSKTGLADRKNRWGWVFIAPWLIGVVYFFLLPLFNSIYYTLTKIEIGAEGLNFEWVGLENYISAFTVDAEFSRNIVSSVGNLVYSVPIIVFFSLFIALILHGDFKGRTAMRSIFFLPVIISSGVVITILQENVLADTTSGQAASTIFQTGVLNEVLIKAGMPSKIVKILTDTVGQIFDLTWKSGVQILLILSALHSIPDSMYEAAKIEGATGWEIFWKITFVLISPTLILAVIYTIIDYFTDYSNKVMRMIVDYTRLGRYEYSTTISICYFVVVMFFIFLVNTVLNRASNKALN